MKAYLEIEKLEVNDIVATSGGVQPPVCENEFERD